MPIEVDEAILAEWRKGTGGCRVRLESDDLTDASLEAVLVAARARLARVTHPEEPEDCLASYMSPVTASGRVAEFWFDAADAEVHEGALEAALAAIVDAIRGVAVSGRLSAPSGPGPVSKPELGVVRLRAELADLPLPAGIKMDTTWSRDDCWDIRFSIEAEAEDVVKFFEQRLPECGFPIIASFREMGHPSGPFDASVLFELGLKIGRANVMGAPGRPSRIHLSSYPAGSPQDVLARLLGSGEALPDSIRWRIKPTHLRR